MTSILTGPVPGSDVDPARLPLHELRRYRHRTMRQLRFLEHWRRLVAARLDLAVATVADLEEPDHVVRVPGEGLRELLGLGDDVTRLAETAMLLRLRGALQAVDAEAATLRRRAEDATRELLDRLDGDLVDPPAGCED